MGISFWWFLKVLSGLGLIGECCFLFFRNTQPSLLDSDRLYWGQFFILFGAFLSLWHYFLLKRAKIQMKQPHQLLTQQGLFRWIRHPMYFGDLFVLFGFSIWCQNLMAFILLSLGWISLAFQCKIEDQLLAQQFPEEHALWSKKTYKLLPGIY